MAKVIKFNLRCDGNPVRTIEDLQENFSLEDVLSYYDNKLLHKWLSVRGYEEELEKVNAITSDAQGDIIKSLADIFEIDEDPATLDEKITILNYERDKRNIFEKAKESGKGHAAVVSNYISRYEQLVRDTISEIDREKIKFNIKIIENEFYDLFKIGWHDAMLSFFDKNIYALIYILNNEILMKCVGFNMVSDVGFYYRYGYEKYGYYLGAMEEPSGIVKKGYLNLCDKYVWTCKTSQLSMIIKDKILEMMFENLNKVKIIKGTPEVFSDGKEILLLHTELFKKDGSQEPVYINDEDIRNVTPLSIIKNFTASTRNRIVWLTYIEV